MQVNVKHGLSCRGIAVHDDAVAILRNAFLGSYLRRRQHEVADSYNFV